MSDRDNSPPLPSPGATERRRSSFSASALADLFTRPSVSGGASAAPNAGASNSPPTYPGPITTAAAQAQRRRLSLTTLGLSGSPNQTSPFQNGRSRGESMSSATSGSVDESPFEDDMPASSTSVPSTPFARRLSFGARALRDVRTGNGSAANANGRSSIAKSSSPPTTKSRGLSYSSPSAQPPSRSSPPLFSRSFSSYFPSSIAEDESPDTDPISPNAIRLTRNLPAGEGFNFAENLRSRAERSSVSGPPSSAAQTQQHFRTKSMAGMEPPIREVPAAPKGPDAFQERILKGDFYMD